MNTAIAIRFPMPPASVQIRIVADGAGPSTMPLGNHLRPRHLARRVQIDPADDLDARERLVQILQLVLLDLAVDRDGLVVVVELHVARVVAHGDAVRLVAVAVEVLVVQRAVLRQHAVGVHLALVVVDAVEHVVLEVVAELGALLVSAGTGTAARARAAAGLSAVDGPRDGVDGRVDNLADVLAERRDDGVEVDAVEHAADHDDDVLQPRLELDLGRHVLDGQLDAVDARVHAGAKVQQLQHLRVEVDLGRDVVDLDADVAHAYAGVEVDVGLDGHDAAEVGVGCFIAGRVGVASLLEAVSDVAIARVVAEGEG